MKVRLGNCTGCGKQDVRITFGWATRKPLCQWCDASRKREKAKAGKKLSRKPTVRQLRNIVLDWEVNMAIWESRPHNCIECGRKLTGDPRSNKQWFSHILPKGAYPRLRHDPMNIVLHCMGCHREWGAGNFREMKTFTLMSTYMYQNGFTK